MKKKHFYHGRIRALSVAFCILIAGLIGIGTIGAQQTKTQTYEHSTLADIATGAGASIALIAPVAMVNKLKTEGKWEKLDDGTKAFLQTMETEINNSLKEGMTETEIKAKYDEWIKAHGQGLNAEQMLQFKDMAQALKDQAVLIQQMKDNGILGGIKVGALTKAFAENKDKIKALKASKTGKLSFEVEMKAGGADQAATDIATHTIGTRVPGVGQLPVRKPFMRDLFPTVTCNSEFIRYLDQETIVRDAKNVASAAVSTHTTKLTWKERNIQITAVRDLIDVPIDMLDDYDFVEGELKNLLDVNVQLKVDTGLLSGTGVNPELHSVGEVASEFDDTNTLGGTIEVWTGKVDDPNFFDLAIAMTSQIIALGQQNNYIPNVILCNTIDKFKNMLVKDDNGQYLMPPFVVRQGDKEYSIDGMVVRSNPGVASNTMYVFDSTKATLYQRKTVVIEMSFENASNFETEVVTIKAYERLNLLVRNVNKNAFMKCSDVAGKIAAISKP
jgi:hypothetical protein